MTDHRSAPDVRPHRDDDDALAARLLSPSNEWAIASPEALASPPPTTATMGNGAAAAYLKDTTSSHGHGHGSPEAASPTVNGGTTTRSRRVVNSATVGSSNTPQDRNKVSASILHRDKRGSSETRGGGVGGRHAAPAAATLLEQDAQRQRGDHDGLQELRHEIDSIKANRRTASVNGLVASGGSWVGASSPHGQKESDANKRRDEGGMRDERDSREEGGLRGVSGLQDERGMRQLPSPPPSIGAAESPVADDHGLEIRQWRRASAHGGNDTTENAARIRATSSALDFGASQEPKSADALGMKQRTMSAHARPQQASRTYSTPTAVRRKTSSQGKPSTPAQQDPSTASPRLNKELPPLKMERVSSRQGAGGSGRYQQDAPGTVSPIPEIMPMPPFTMPAFLQLELSSSRPSPLYMYRPSTSEYPYEPTSAKVERLLNFLYLPPQLERVLWFGAIACVDAWLYNFTILPIRFFSALAKLLRSMVRNLWSEVKFLVEFVPLGLNRVWQRQVTGLHSEATTPILTPLPEGGESGRQTHSSLKGHQQFPFPQDAKVKESQPVPRMSRPKARRHRRSKSVASSLVPAEKADILKGCLILMSTVILMHFDASMMYHSIRGQAAIKLYVIYNVLEVFDKLFSAIGQDILECLFSPESLSRKPDGRSKILRPLSLFPLALIYVLIHATALYYQVITLNVAVNSYSNALLTLLMSNQFVEIKSTVFKRIEKENLFQMTCADVVERFQLWLMLMIIAGRNIIETSASSSSSASSAPATSSTPPPTTPTLLPFIFTLFPSLSSASQILNPFILVLGTETLVDWLKHAYITKFNNVKPNLYGRFLDVLTKDYYANAFSDPNLTKRIGLPVIPLTCLAIRAAVQTYHMAREQLGPAPSSVTELDASAAATLSPTTAAALRHIDALFLRVVGTGNPEAETVGANSSFQPADDVAFLPSRLLAPLVPTTLLSLLPSGEALLSLATSLLLLAAVFLVLLAGKLVLGMLLLGYARRRYATMKRREAQYGSSYQEGRRAGGWGIVEVDEDKRRWIYADDPERLRKLRERDRDTREREGLSTVAATMTTTATATTTAATTTATTATAAGGDSDAQDEDKGGGGLSEHGMHADAAAKASGATTAPPAKGQNYEAVERYKLGASKRIW